MSNYERRLVATPLDDWKLGDPPERWPHAFVGVKTGRGLRCGVWITDGVRCARFADHPIHRTANRQGVMPG